MRLGVGLMSGVGVGVSVGSGVRVGRGVGTIGSRAALQALSAIKQAISATARARGRIRTSDHSSGGGTGS
ncbi:MAG: hypothetical protein CUN51_06815 [Candidatus Thermofonsia Clade 1 bacterium]|uniref:Uncharacterized protein n=1 Tax=Candidatus Thermofonsia Clade 1 bacterium TaxID=2364210 RepID=A0A2M8NZG4_9CHLR|nr:MAG: hypothetical protein CUN51_06815 [Candidatus Thermofonsia Clade 1 bacterium]